MYMYSRVERRRVGPRALLHALHHYPLQKIILADFNLAVSTLTAKTAKFKSLLIFQLYGSCSVAELLNSITSLIIFYLSYTLRLCLLLACFKDNTVQQTFCASTSLQNWLPVTNVLAGKWSTHELSHL